MLAVVLSVLLTVYIVIPEAIFRFLFGLFIPPKAFVLTRTETAYRAVLIALVPFWLALGLSWYVPGPQDWPWNVRQNSIQTRRDDYKIVASDLYSEASFAASSTVFWPAFTRCSRRQSRLLFWYFLLVTIEALVIGFLASEYAKMDHFWWYKWFSNKLLSPYLSHWLPLLKLPDAEVQADILCTNEALYQGNVSEHFLKDGELSGIILSGPPKRFNRKEYLDAKKEGKKPDKNEYWVTIPSQNLYFFADKILNMNLRYITSSPTLTVTPTVDAFLSEQLGKSVSVQRKEGTPAAKLPETPSKS